MSIDVSSLNSSGPAKTNCSGLFPDRPVGSPVGRIFFASRSVLCMCVFYHIEICTPHREKDHDEGGFASSSQKS